MARGRMIDNCISISEKINDLSLREAFIYTWIIPHLDDWGRIIGSPRTLKALVFPMKKEISIGYIEKALIRFKELGLFLWEDINGELILQQPFEEFSNHQSISDNKRAKSKYPEILEPSQEMPRIPKNPQENPVQDNIIKDNIIKDKYKDYVYLSKEEYKKLIDQLGDNKTNEMIERLDLYIGSKGDHYKSHYYTILNWIRKDKPVDKKPEEKWKEIKEIPDYRGNGIPEDIKSIMKNLKGK